MVGNLSDSETYETLMEKRGNVIIGNSISILKSGTIAFLHADQ